MGAHPRVQQGGELPQFAIAVVDAVNRGSGGTPIAREELIKRSTSLDFSALGQDYLKRARAGGIDAQCFTDKMPLNYFYCGLIRRALPNARIVHVRRHPVAACYAMYKTLFQGGYPFSYDLEELGRYYIAYRRLMRHWAATLPGAIYELRYEDLIRNLQNETRRVLQFCGLDWDNACVNFHANPSPITTASAAQARRPLYETSISQWRHYRRQLASLEEQLQEAGIHED